MTQPFLSVVIPAYNEETNIRLGAFEKVARYLDSQAYTWEVIIVDDGSSDRTGMLTEEFIEHNNHFSLVKNPHQGKAATVMTGMMKACGEIVLFSDLDQATPLKEVEKILPWFEKGCDVVIGSRKGKREGAPLLRRFMARGFMILRTVVLGLRGISDTQCGFKAFRQQVARDIFQHLSLYGKQKIVSGAMVTAGFDIEVLFLAKMLGYKIKEIPVEWHYVETRRVNPIKDSWEGLMDIVHIRINAWKGVYRKG
ncbi:MAG: glycosyltransferase [Candidatus Gottesmanbacteria bacterium]